VKAGFLILVDPKLYYWMGVENPNIKLESRKAKCKILIDPRMDKHPLLAGEISDRSVKYILHFHLLFYILLFAV